MNTVSIDSDPLPPIKTATGIWSVTYNGENRPILWSQGTNTIVMSYDCKGRRVTKNEEHFVYNGYLQIADSTRNIFIWDPTELISTCPIAWNALRNSGDVRYYIYDGNKNVSQIVSCSGDVIAHYAYAPFGAVTALHGAVATANPWRFSCEYSDDSLGLVYYNFRHFDPRLGCWVNRDPIDELGSRNLYAFAVNAPVGRTDVLGLIPAIPPALAKCVANH